MAVEEIYKQISNPKKFGQGYWTYLHQVGLDSETDEEIDFYIKTSYRLTKYVPCGDCNEAGIQFMKENDPETYRNWRDSSGKRRGMFKHSVDYHNHANKRTGAKEMSYEDALEIWGGVKDGACKEGCSHSPENEIQSSTPQIASGSFIFGKPVSNSFYKETEKSNVPNPFEKSNVPNPFYKESQSLSERTSVPNPFQTSKSLQSSSKIIPVQTPQTLTQRTGSIFSSSYNNELIPSTKLSPEKGSKLSFPQQISTGESSDEEGDIIEDEIVIGGKSFPISIRTGQKPTAVKTGQVIYSKY